MGSIAPTNKTANATAKTHLTSGVKYGQRLLPQAVDLFAEEDASYIVGMMAKPGSSSSIPLDFTTVSISQLANAINFMARWIDQRIGSRTTISETLCFVGMQDFRYWAVELASMKTGHPLLIPSPRNALPNTASLLDVTSCKILFYSGGGGPMEAQARALQKLVPGLKIFEVPSLADMVHSKTAHYPYTKTWEEAKDDRVLIVHTSGSTGNPKPIVFTNAFLGRLDNDRFTPVPEGRMPANLMLLREGKRCYLGTPFVHLSGIAIGFAALLNRYTVVMGPPDVLPNGRLVCDVAKSVEISGMVLVPSLLDAIFSEHGEEMREPLKSLEHICWLGGEAACPVNWRLDRPSATTHTPLADIWLHGSLLIPTASPPPSHWSYIEWHPDLAPDMERETRDSDLYEAVVRRHPNPDFAWCRPVFLLFPEKEEWRTRDLFKRCEEPGLGNLWHFQGRVDDMMILGNGLKANPLHIEMRLLSDPNLKGCVVFGENRTKCGLLLEHKDESLSTEDVVEAVWPNVERANALVPEHARIGKELVIVASPGKPFPRAAKGTIVRSLTVKLYEQEIEETYARVT